MVKLEKVKAREVIDSRGNPTVEVQIDTSKGRVFGIAPSGASIGRHEALEIRDHKKAYLGLGVTKAVRNVPLLAQRLKGKQLDMIKADRIISKAAGKNKIKFGANATTALSIAVARADALNRGLPLYKYISYVSGRKLRMPVPFANVINGGKHASGGLEIQELMIVPVKAKSFRQATQMISETYHVLKQDIIKKIGKESANVADEGGFVPKIANTYEALSLLNGAIEDAGYQRKMKIAIDAAASNFYYIKRYVIDGEKFFGDGLIDKYQDLINMFPVISIEDPFAEDDFRNFKMFYERIGHRIQVVGDDLLVTNPERIKFAIKEKLCDTLLMKVNQIGTVTEALDAAKLAFDAGWNVMVSHRSGETEDTFISDLACGLGCGQIKLGAPCRGERTAKYNRLLRIEEELGKKVKFGWQ
ncbi:phosphopyruvate hydratase [Candidatus Woesearchaeota archaeon]|nr:MAG: phosphopyruvate hydratase [Candidatus Woesearchaeota archaeon]